MSLGELVKFKNLYLTGAFFLIERTRDLKSVT